MKVGRVFDRLKGPVLADPELTVGGDGPPARPGADPRPHPRPVRGGPDRPARPVSRRRAARVHPPRATTGGRRATFQFRLSLDGATTRNGFVPRLWASRKIGLLVDAIREQGADGRSSLARGQATHPRRGARAGRGDRPALDRVRHPDRVHRVPRPRGDRPVAGRRSSSRGRGPLPLPRDPDAERARLGESGHEQPGPQGVHRASTRSTSSSAPT